MKVIAKFKVETVGPIAEDGSVSGVTLVPVVGGSKENEDFFKWTPGGKIELGTTNANAAKAFKLGQEVYVEFTPVEAPEAVPEPTQEERISPASS